MSDPGNDSELSEDNGNYLIFKVRVKAKQTNTNALVIIIIDESKRKIVKISAAASRFSMLNDTEPGVPWYIFNETLDNIKLKGDISARITADLQTSLANAMEKDKGNELITYLKHNDNEKIESFIQSVSLRAISDDNIEVDFASENIPQTDYNKIRKERKDPRERKINQAPNHAVKGDIFDIDLILAPVSGIPINKLKKGDHIMVRIIGNAAMKKKPSTMPLIIFKL